MGDKLLCCSDSWLFLLIVLIEKRIFAAALRTVRYFIATAILYIYINTAEFCEHSWLLEDWIPTAEDWEDFHFHGTGEQHCSRAGELP